MGGVECGGVSAFEEGSRSGVVGVGGYCCFVVCGHGGCHNLASADFSAAGDCCWRRRSGSFRHGGCYCSAVYRPSAVLNSDWTAWCRPIAAARGNCGCHACRRRVYGYWCFRGNWTVDYPAGASGRSGSALCCCCRFYSVFRCTDPVFISTACCRHHCDWHSFCSNTDSGVVDASCGVSALQGTAVSHSDSTVDESFLAEVESLQHQRTSCCLVPFGRLRWGVSSGVGCVGCGWWTS